MKKILLLLFLISSVFVYSEKDNHKISIVGELGVNYFDGDVSQNSISIFPGSIRQLTFGGEIEYSLTPIWGLSLNYYHLPLKGENNYVSFETNYNTLEFNSTVNFTKLIFPKSKSKLSFNGSIGVGYAHYTFNPIIKNIIVTSEAIPNYGNSFTIPVSLYTEYSLSNNLSIGCKYRYISNNKDNLEGIVLAFSTPEGVKHYSSGGYDSNSNDNIDVFTLYARYKFSTKKSKIHFDEKIPMKDTLVINDKNCCGDTYNITNNYNINSNINSNNGCKTCNDSLTYVNNNGISDDFVNRIPSIYFDFDKYNLDYESSKIVRHIAEILMKFHTYNVEIRGYCDYMGNIPYNETLSVNRVNRVKYELINVYHISESHIIVNGLGKIDYPKMKYRSNRRCDFFFFK